MRTLRQRSGEWVRALLVTAWVLTLAALVLPDGPPGSLLLTASGVLLLVAAAVLGLDGGRATAALNARYGRGRAAPDHRFMGAVMVAIGVLFAFAGVHGTLT